MNIVRILKNNNHREYFQALRSAGLIGYLSGGYEKWHWQYLENPFCLTRDPAIWVYVLDGKKVGHLGGIAVDLKLGSQKINAAWAVDFATLTEYGKRGIGRSLVEEACRSFDLLLTVGQTDMSFNLFIKMGWKFLGYLPYYIRIYDARALIKNRIKNIIILNIISMPLNFLFAVLNYFKKPQKPKNIEVRLLDNFTEEADLFWEEISEFYKITVPRNQAYLNWKYDRQPNIHYMKFRAERNGKVCGYIILRGIKTDLPNPEGLIADLVVHPEDKETIEALLFTALRYFRKENCSLVRCYINNRHIQKYLRHCGFLKRKPYMRFLISKEIDNSLEMINLDNWYLSAGDCDIDR